MKHLLALLGLILPLAVTAQNFLSQDFLNVRSVQVTNGIGATNLNSFGVAATNFNGIVYTNLAGTRLETGTTNNTFNLFKDAQLWADRNGRPFMGIETNNMVSTSPGSVFLKLVGGSGANAAVTFVFRPVVDGQNESTAAADTWSVALTATTTTPVTLRTNVPFYLWPGCKGLRLRSIVNGDTDASSGVFVQECSLNGFLP